MKRRISIVVLFLVFTLCSTAYAGQWFKDGDKWAYTGDDGNRIKEGWFQDTDGKVYNFNGGVTRSGFYKEGTSWYYFDPVSGERKSGWVVDKDKTYLMNVAGVMQTGWQYVNGLWYYMDGSGVMYADKVADINGNRYYFHTDGHMAVNEWVKDATYFAQADGRIATSTWVEDGKYANSSGKVTEKETTEKKEKIDNKVFTLQEYKQFAEDAYGRYSNSTENLIELIQAYREEWNEDHVYNYEGDDDSYIDNNELPEFRWDDNLSKAAALRAVELASQQRASGARPDGRRMETVLEDYDISYTRVVESVAFGQSDYDACYEDLEDNGTHTGYWRQKSYDRIGAGLAYDTDGKAYWVVLYVE